MKRSVSHLDRTAVSGSRECSDGTATTTLPKSDKGQRRKRSTETAFSSTDNYDSTYNENNGVPRQRSEPSQPNKPPQTRPNAKIKRPFDSVQNETLSLQPHCDVFVPSRPESIPSTLLVRVSPTFGSTDPNAPNNTDPIHPPSPLFQTNATRITPSKRVGARTTNNGKARLDRGDDRLDSFKIFASANPYNLFASYQELNDIFDWDMDHIPSIPSSPDSPERLRLGKTPANCSFPPLAHELPPFSEPIDEDDDSSDSDIPFSVLIARPPVKIVHEDMGVRKSKHRQKSRGSLVASSSFIPAPNITPSIPARTTRASTPALTAPTIVLESTSNDPFYPLPVKRLRSSPPERPTPWSNPSELFKVPPLSTFFNDPRISEQEPHRLKAEECELMIAFPQTSHFEIWDMDDSSFVSCPVLLCLVDNRRNMSVPLADPDVTLVEITCDDIPIPLRIARYNATDEYSIVYSDVKTGTAKDCLIRKKSPTYLGSPSRNLSPSLGGGGLKSDIAVRPGASSSDEIELDGRWTRMYSRPRASRHAVAHPPQKQKSHVRSAHHPIFNPYLPSSLSFLDQTSNNAPETHPSPSYILTHSDANGQTAFGGKACGFYLKLWIPIPLRLFTKRETRVFHVAARVWLNGDEEWAALRRGDSWLVEGGQPLDAFPEPHRPHAASDPSKSHAREPNGLTAHSEMSISHLRTPRWL